MTSQDNNFDKFEQTKAFVEAQINRYASYHQSKEAMAYAGITLFGGVAGTAAVSGAWPPAWGKHSLLLAIMASTFLWAAVLTFVRFQLTRRRWAALRVAGCERLLASWLQGIPPDEDLTLAPEKSMESLSVKTLVANLLWGSKAAVRAVKTNEAVYPRALVNSLLAQEAIGTDALKHERLILLCGWSLYVILIVSAWLKSCYVVI